MPESNSITVEIPLPLASECYACSVTYYLEEIRPADIVAMAERRWICDCCNEVCSCESHPDSSNAFMPEFEGLTVQSKAPPSGVGGE